VFVKRFIKWSLRLLVLLVLLLVVAVLSLDSVVKALIERGVRRDTGQEIKIGRLEIGLLNPRFTLENVILYNPPEFGGAPMLDVPELHLVPDLAAALNRRLRFRVVRFHLAEVNIVKNGPGANNFETLGERTEKNRKAREASAGQSEPTVFSGIDALTLTLGRVHQTDLKNPERSREFDMGVKNEVFTGIKDESDLQGRLLPILVRIGIGASSAQRVAATNRAPVKAVSPALAPQK